MDTEKSDSMLTEIKNKRSRFSGSATKARESAIDNLDDLIIHRESTTTRETKTTEAITKLQESRISGEQMKQELGQICAGLEEELAEIGYAINVAHTYKGFSENVFYALGWMGFTSMANKAEQMRITRLENQSIEESTKLIIKLAGGTEDELRLMINQFKDDGEAYKASMARVLKKLAQATPEHGELKQRREELEGAIKSLRLELESGTLDVQERPQKEKELEDMEREHDNVLLQESDKLSIINNAQRAIPELKQSITAASQSVIAINQMQRDMHEKMQNLVVIVERAMTTVVAQAKIERYNTVDPVFNKTVTLARSQAINFARAAMDTAMNRAEKSAVDPETSDKLLNKLLGDINDYLLRYAKLEEEAARGVRRPSSGVADSKDESAESASAKTA